MRLALLALGTRGDVQPCIALGLGLEKAGFELRFAAYADFEPFVTQHGLTFAPIAGNERELTQSEQGQELHETDRNPLRTMLQMSRMLQALPQAYWDSFWEACRGAEAILCLPSAPHGYHIAEKLGIPAITVSLSPLIGRTRKFPSPYLHTERRLGGLYNLATHVLFEQIIWHPFRPAFNKWRRQTLKLPPVPFAGPYARIQRQPILYGYSPAVMPPPPEWSDRIHVTGYWFLDRPADWKPPVDLVRFLQTGPPPVYVGFGSGSNREPEHITRLVLQALERVGQRGILLTGSGGLSHTTLPDTVFALDSAPFDWLFPQTAAVVHHGGAGTMAAALRAGVPAITIPSWLDQFVWGRQTAKLGVGPPLIPRQQLSVERLQAALGSAVGDQAMRARAAVLGETIRAEDGVAQAVQAVRHHLRA